MIPGHKHRASRRGTACFGPIRAARWVPVVITQRNQDSMVARYERLLDGGTQPTLAKRSLARMMAATVLRRWKDEERYDPERGGPLIRSREG